MGEGELVRLRRASVDDARDIAAVHVHGWQAAYRDLMPANLLAGLSVDRRAGGWEALIADASDASRQWVATMDDDDTVVGFVAAGAARGDDLPPGTGEVFAIYVEPRRWRQGVGRELLARAMLDLERAGFRAAVLWVLADNAAARRFYEAAGWAADGTARIEQFGDAQVAEVRYRRELGAHGSSA